MLKRTKIMATVGPVSGSQVMLRALVEAGVDVFRINFSHGDEPQRAEFLANIRAVEAKLERPVAVCGDLCGPKIRVGMMQAKEVQLEAGQQIVIQRTTIEGTAERISTTLPELVDVVQTGEEILLADGRLRLVVGKTSPPDQFTCRVVTGGPLSSGKGVNLPYSNVRLSALTEKDRHDIGWIGQHELDYVALSFVRTADDVVELRKLLEEQGSEAHIISKIEKPQALDHIDAIIHASDAVMVARGDLGVEMDFPVVPIAQKRIAHKCQAAGKPCIIATEMLESMIRAPRPTRAEVSDVANAVFDHADAVMLSAESAIGEYPIEAVTAMRQTVLAAEEYLEELGRPVKVRPREPETTAALAASIRTIMEMEEIAAIVAYTATGTTARLISKNRPECPVVALASEPTVARRPCLYYAVVPRLVKKPDDVQRLLKSAGKLAKGLGVAAKGDRILVLAGEPLGGRESTKGIVVEEVD